MTSEEIRATLEKLIRNGSEEELKNLLAVLTELLEESRKWDRQGGAEGLLPSIPAGHDRILAKARPALLHLEN